MEKQLFTWENCDIRDVYNCGALLFYPVTLVVPIGEYPVGTVFESAVVDFQKGKLSFNDSEGKTIVTYKLSLSIGEKL